MEKIVFYNQPIAHRFGTALTDNIASGAWKTLELAVAWVRRSGTRHLKPSLNQFLSRGGTARFTVGVDIENTSKEGLRDLLDLQNAGDAETYIYHNEASATFHPKVYLLGNNQKSCLIVGSNNITEAGLFANTEAGLEIQASNQDPVIAEVRTALEYWRNETTGFVKRLDDTLLKDLAELGYIYNEITLSQRRTKTEKDSKAERAKAKKALFKSLHIAIPLPPPLPGGTTDTIGTVLLMRVRRASEKERRTQVQIPARVLDTQFFEGISQLKSAHDGRLHSIIFASARGGVNTRKLELPEINSFVDPVVRLERTDSEIVYQTFDATSILGHPIITALKEGLESHPRKTSQTVSDASRATLWRFI